MVVRSTPARATHPQHIGYIRCRLTAPFDAVAGKVFDAKLPAFANIVGVHNNVITTFTGGVPLLTVGVTGDAGLDNIVAVMSEAAAKEFLQPVTAFAIPTVDTEVRALMSGGATVGEAEITILYVPTRL